MGFKVWCPELGDQPEEAEFEATDPEDAAEKWAEWHDQDCRDRPILDGNTLMVCVLCEDGRIEQYEVSGEVVPRYYAWFAGER